MIANVISVIATICITVLVLDFDKHRNFFISFIRIVRILLGLGIEVPGYAFALLIIFGLLDGSMHTISQYWLSSSIRESLEFANRAYLFINNINRAVGIFIGEIFVDAESEILLLITSVIYFVLACPIAIYRIRKFSS